MAVKEKDDGRRIIMAYDVAGSLIPYKEEILEEFSKILNSGILVGGDQTTMLEKQVAKSMHKEYGVALVSDTLAMQVALMTAVGEKGLDQIEKLPTVYFPDTAFPGMVMPAIQLFDRVELVPVNIDEEFATPSINQVLETVSPHSIFVASYNAGMAGVSAEEIIESCKEKGIYVIEDCCHAHGARYTSGCPVGSKGDTAIFSLYATKVVTAGNGAVLVTDSESVYQEAKALRNYGKFGAKFVTLSGGDFRLTEFQAAIGGVLWDNMDDLRVKRASVADVYDRFFSERDNVYPLGTYPGQDWEPSYYKYIVMVPSMCSIAKNKFVKDNMEERGIYLQEKCNLQTVSEVVYALDRKSVV